MLVVTSDWADLIERVKTEVDVQRLVEADDDAEDFGRYRRQHCLNPEHPDQNPTMLVYQDGVYCSGCGYRGDAVDIYQLWHPELSKVEAAKALLTGNWTRTEGDAAPRVIRQLDQDLALKYHLALASNLEALAGLEAFGFTRKAIRRFQLGLALTRVRDESGTFGDQQRFAVPVFNGGRLVQVLYRKLDASQAGGKVVLEKDAGSWLFNRDALEGADTVIVCEGWGDVITLWQWGLVGVCSTNGAGHWSQEWNEDLARARRLYVVGDADNAGKRLVDRVRRTIPWARPIELPFEHGSKGDIRDLALGGGTAETFKRLMRDADLRGLKQFYGGKQWETGAKKSGLRLSPTLKLST